MAESSYVNIDLDKISEALNEKTDRNLLNLNSVGQEIIDGKVEVEALLAQNGYAKFTWKEGNKVAILLQWGSFTTSTTTYSYPISFSNAVYAFAFSQSGQGSATIERYAFKSKATKTKFTVQSSSTSMCNMGAYWICIGS